ncbi:GntR family transcriptional regulator [Lactobacillus panisapium]|uniref:GntR family transcriptional regulator n=1 Tax=Lactobacillus panisapium TaxID=2012495 RepID=A0ABX8W9C5_9LACO|nr:GntR family transcriptional regulator [Lactobacillus panisapium]QYN52382.1 GntR family transcriptional regulator [Lactobacillus panisapium]
MSSFLYQDAKKQILNLISTGQFKPNAKIWNERILAEELGYTRATIKNAINSLVEDNILEKRRGDGTYLVKGALNNAFEIGDDSPNSFTQIMKINQRQAVNRVESFKLIYDDPELAQVFANQDSAFYELCRTRSVNSTVIAVQKSYIPFRLFEDAHRYDFSKMSLYDYMDYQNHKPVNFQTEIETRSLDDNEFVVENIHLDQAKYAYLLFLEYRGFTAKNEMVEYTKSWYNPDFISYKINVKR